MSNQEQSIYLSLFAISIITIVVLFLVVLFQNSRIKELTEPKFGFLGKPINVGIFTVFILGSFSLMLFWSGNKTSDSNIVNVSDGISINLDYKTDDEGSYIFTLTPIIDGKSFGADENLTFNVLWSIEGDSLITFSEEEISLNKKSNYRVTLEEGTYKVSAVLFIEGIEFRKEIEIEVK